MTEPVQQPVEQPVEQSAQQPAVRAGGQPDPVRGMLRRALRDVLVFLTVLGVLGFALGALLVEDRTAAMWGALIGWGLALVFSASTVLVMLLTARRSLTAAMGALVGTWLVKTLLVLVVVALLRDQDFYDRAVLVLVVVVGVLGSVLLDYRAVVRGRVPYVAAEDGADRPGSPL